MKSDEVSPAPRTAVACTLALCAAWLAADGLRVEALRLPARAVASRWDVTVGGLGWVRADASVLSVLVPLLMVPLLVAVAAGRRSRLAHWGVGVLSLGAAVVVAVVGFRATRVYLGWWQWMFAAWLGGAAALVLPAFERPGPDEPLSPEARAASRRALAAVLAAFAVFLRMQPGVRTILASFWEFAPTAAGPGDITAISAGPFSQLPVEREFQPWIFVGARALRIALPALWAAALAAPRLRVAGVVAAVAAGAASSEVGAFVVGRQAAPLMLLGDVAWLAAFIVLPRAPLLLPASALLAAGCVIGVVAEVRIATWVHARLVGVPGAEMMADHFRRHQLRTPSSAWTASAWVIAFAAVAVTWTANVRARRFTAAACAVAAAVFAFHPDVAGATSVGIVAALLILGAAAAASGGAIDRGAREGVTELRAAVSVALATFAAVLAVWLVLHVAALGKGDPGPPWLVAAVLDWVPDRGRPAWVDNHRWITASYVVCSVLPAIVWRAGRGAPVRVAAAVLAAVAAWTAWANPIRQAGSSGADLSWCLAPALATLALFVMPSRRADPPTSTP
ncbi:MAG: hypothetical protein HMLKMBBP_01835 [Planctomycetes bacterium]|nr:hypothetical protein [Planctomycetota bacterium]